MLHEFITTHRDAIIEKAQEKLQHRCWPPVSARELERGVPLLVNQLADTLRSEGRATPVSMEAIGRSEVEHAKELRALELAISQVVHDYGDICEAIVELAGAQRLTISGDEMQMLTRCLDTAAVEAAAGQRRLIAAPPAQSNATVIR